MNNQIYPRENNVNTTPYNPNTENNYTNYQQMPVPNNSPGNDKVNVKTVLVCIVSVLLIICCILCVFLVVKNNKQSTQTTSVQTSATQHSTTETTTVPETSETRQETTTAMPSTQAPTEAQTQGKQVKVNLDVAAGSGNLLNIRKGPGYDYDIKTTIKNGTVVTLLKQENGWSYIDYGSGQGWCDTEVAGF